MAYMLNIPPNQAVNGSKPVITTDSNEQMARLQEQNQTLQRKLHSKTTENQRLTAKLEKLESDLELYKQLLQQINQNLSNGEQVPCKWMPKSNDDFFNSMHASAQLEKKLFWFCPEQKFVEVYHLKNWTAVLNSWVFAFFKYTHF